MPNDSCGGNCAPYSNVAVMALLQREIDPLLFRYQVNLAFAGHFHNVQRQGAVYQGRLVQHSVETVDAQGNVVHVQNNPQATVHMVIGSAGNGPSFSNKQYNWSEASWDNLYGYAVVTATNATHLQWHFIESATDRIVDRLVITQDFSAWQLPTAQSEVSDTVSIEYSPHAQQVVLVIGIIMAFFTAIGAYFHHKRTKVALRLINGQHQLLDQTEHAAAAGGVVGVGRVLGVGVLGGNVGGARRVRGLSSGSSDDGVV